MFPVRNGEIQRRWHGNIVQCVPNGGFWLDGNVPGRQQCIHRVL